MGNDSCITVLLGKLELLLFGTIPAFSNKFIDPSDLTREFWVFGDVLIWLPEELPEEVPQSEKWEGIGTSSSGICPEDFVGEFRLEEP